jgi:hypothetical protein
MKTTLMMTLLCCAATGVATSASAELTYGKAYAKYYDFDGGNSDLTALGGAIEARTGGLTFSANVLDLDTDLGGGTIASLGGGFELQNGVTLGLDYTDISIDNDPDNVGILSAYAQYTFGVYTLGLSAGNSSDLSDTLYSVYGAWDVSPTGTVGVDVLRVEGETLVAAYADYDLEQYSLRADLVRDDGTSYFAVSGGYDLGNRFTVIGSLGVVDGDAGDLTGVSVGAQYELAAGVDAELSVGRLDVDGVGNANVLSVGLNYEMGRKTSKRRTLGDIAISTMASAAGLGSF